MESALVDKLFADRSKTPLFLCCRTCGTKLVHMHTTFFTLEGQEWTVPLPLCPLCNDESEIDDRYGKKTSVRGSYEP